MALYIGDELIAGDVEGQKINNPFSLFDFRFSDQILNNTSWLRADTFSWASGAVYVSAYEHLVADITGITAETENIGNHTVTFYRAADGHKICLADQETIVNDIFTTTGVAWYYILDIANQRFKLPRTKFGFTGLRDNVGNYVPESLPNIRGSLIVTGKSDVHDTIPSTVPSGAFKVTSGQQAWLNGGNYGTISISGGTFDASLSSPTYQDNAPVQERATQMYLYFYVGETVQDANIIAAGQALTDIADLKAHSIVETYVNGTSWYRVYSDGWCEQGGLFPSVSSDQDITITLVKPFKDTNYTVNTIRGSTNYNTNVTWYWLGYFNKTNFNFTTRARSAGNGVDVWQACGYIS